MSVENFKMFPHVFPEAVMALSHVMMRKIILTGVSELCRPGEGEKKKPSDHVDLIN